MDGGSGADSLRGETGNDTYVIDDVGDVIVESSGTDTVRSTINYTLPATVEHLQLLGSAVTGTGNTVSNRITGNALNNTLRGEAGNDVLDGAAGTTTKVDRLNGGLGADTFILGDGGLRYYDDLSSGSGQAGYAVIEDFTPSQSDRLRLTGDRAEYFMGASPFAETPGSAIYHDSNGNRALDVATDELIAILVSAEALTLANTVGNASASLDPTVVGIDQPLRAAILGDTGGVEFVMSEALPAGVTLEVQSSIDLGIEFPWQTIAAKTGTNAWTGPASVTVGVPLNGRVTVTIRDVQPLGVLQQNFFRARLFQ